MNQELEERGVPERRPVREAEETEGMENEGDL